MLIAVYGTLMSGHCRSGALERWADLVGPCEIRGDLYAVHGGAFPALRPGDGTVKGELWRARSQEDAEALLRTTDRIESYNPEREGSSMYLRRLVPLIEPGVEAFTYVWNYGLGGLTPIPSGDWREFQDGVFA